MKGIFIAIISAFLASGALLMLVLPLLRRLKAGQYILGYVKEHKDKGGTPTMGGLAFVCAIVIVGFCTLGFGGGEANLTLAITASFMVVGFLDDFIKIYHKKNEGLKPYQKIIFQVAIATVAALYCYFNAITEINIPFTSISVNIDWGIIPLVHFHFYGDGELRKPDRRARRSCRGDKRGVSRHNGNYARTERYLFFGALFYRSGCACGFPRF